MGFRQAISRPLYKALMAAGKLRSQDKMIQANKQRKEPVIPFRDLHTLLGNGKELHFSQLPPGKVLVVNTASACGFTPQYQELQKLYDQKKGGGLSILAFPSNEFGGQEPGSDAEIEKFCSLHFGVEFPLAVKSHVKMGPGQSPVYSWLTDPAKNGWNRQAPDWNFGKYLINEQGVLTHYFAPAVSPLDPRIIEAIEIPA